MTFSMEVQHVIGAILLQSRICANAWSANRIRLKLFKRQISLFLRSDASVVLSISNCYCLYAVFFVETNSFRFSNLKLYFRRQSIPRSIEFFLRERRLAIKHMT